MKRKFNRIIITNSIDECDEAIKRINRDDKTNYTEEAFIIGSDFEVKHLVETDHNILNFKRKYNDYNIE
jgi:hypothetical protein